MGFYTVWKDAYDIYIRELTKFRREHGSDVKKEMQILKRNIEVVNKTKSTWKRDLTRECIESNPGPSVMDIVNKLEFIHNNRNQFLSNNIFDVLEDIDSEVYITGNKVMILDTDEDGINYRLRGHVQETYLDSSNDEVEVEDFSWSDFELQSQETITYQPPNNLETHGDDNFDVDTESDSLSNISLGDEDIDSDSDFNRPISIGSLEITWMCTEDSRDTIIADYDAEGFSVFDYIAHLKVEIEAWEIAYMLNPTEEACEQIIRLRASVESAGGWIRDLTEEGIEPNPGPVDAFGFLSAQLMCLEAKYGFAIDHLEAIAILLFNLKRERGNDEILVAILNYLKHTSCSGALVTSSNVINSLHFAQEIIDTHIQSGEDDFFESLGSLLENYELAKESKCYRKVYKFIMYMLSLSAFSSVGITMSNLDFTALEQEAIKRKYHLGPDFVHCLLDTFVFLYTRGVQCAKIGSLEPIYHDGSTYSKWAERVRIIKHKSNFLSNPSIHGFTMFDYIADLRDIVEEGKCIKKSLLRGDALSKKLLDRSLSEVEYLLGMAITKREALKPRRAPFSLLVHGNSGVAKSTFMAVLNHYFSTLFSLPQGSEYIYTRNALDEFWPGFNSSQWGLILDDVAFMNPNKVTDLDLTLKELILIVNSVSFVPTQAALEDKGKTPMRCEIVLASTNTMDMNVNQYFSCPLAAMRRLPYVVSISPKPEYTQYDCMIDGDKVPPIKNGEFPDYWIIKVYKVRPHDLNKPGCPQYGQHDLIETFTDINIFLQWFGSTSTQFRKIQEKEELCKENLQNTDICKKCFLISNLCECLDLQSSESAIIRTPVSDDHWTDYFAMFLIWLYFRFPTLAMFAFHSVFYVFLRGKYGHSGRVSRYYLETLGNTQRSRFGGLSKSFTKTLFVLGTSGVAVAFLYKFLCKGKEEKRNKQTSACDSLYVNKLDEDQDVITIQGSSGSKPEPDKVQIENVWFKDDFQITSVDITRQTTSMKGLPIGKIRSMIHENCVTFKSYSDIKNKHFVTHAFCVGGQYYLANNHGIPDYYPDHKIQITFSNQVSGVREQYNILLTESMIRRMPENDICLIWLPQVRPRKKLTNLFCKSSLYGVHKGTLLRRDINGETKIHTVHNCVYTEMAFPVKGFVRSGLWKMFVEPLTEIGDCGSVILSESVNGPIILGIHVGVIRETSFSLKVTFEDVEDLIRRFDIPLIQSGSVDYSTPSSPQELGDVHNKSEVRYVRDGNALVYGSFKGFKSKPKSRVVKTPISRYLEDRGFVRQHGPPEMKGWEPWRNNLLPCLDKNTYINVDLMLHCVDSFVDDIVKGLPIEAKSKILCYDDFTVVNGACGVRFVDRMNHSTSAGFPFNKSKKNFTKVIPAQHGFEEPVEYNEEIMSRVRECIDRYENKTMYHPIYMGSLKDEPRSFKKIKEKNTRVFTGGPVEHVFVTRRELLSYAKVIQENKFVSECAAGTIAQSTEWDNIYKYLTYFGEDRIFDGDYSKFDKSMEATMIIMVFKVITGVLERCGADQDHINRCWCVGYDLAFAFINFNGTLIQFCKGHVSGEALTVIVNSHCNSLYIRYAYALCNKYGTCEDFKQNINLMTYGDDFVGGVRPGYDFDFIKLKTGLSSIGLKVTPADKEASDYTLMHIKDINFLKRGFRYDQILKRVVCPLDEASIHKSLMVCVQSKTVTIEKQVVDIISSAVREYFWYGKTTFEIQRDFFMRVIDDFPDLRFYVQESTFPTYDCLVKSYWEASKQIEPFDVKRHLARFA